MSSSSLPTPTAQKRPAFCLKTETILADTERTALGASLYWQLLYTGKYTVNPGVSPGVSEERRGPHPTFGNPSQSELWLVAGAQIWGIGWRRCGGELGNLAVNVIYPVGQAIWLVEDI